MNFEEEYLYESDVDVIQKTLKSSHIYMEGITFESLRKNGWERLRLPSPWVPHAEGKFATTSGKCEFFSPALKEKNVSPLPEYHPVEHTSETLKNYPLHLLAIKSTSNFLNSSHANVRHLLDKEGTPYLEKRNAG